MTNFGPKTGIPFSHINKYLSNCSAATKDAKKCFSSLTYTDKDDDKAMLDCSKFCFDNCDVWINDMFREENIPISATFASIFGTYNIDIKDITITMGNLFDPEGIKGTIVYIKKGRKHHEIKCDECKNDIKRAGNVFCKFIKDNIDTPNLFINITISMTKDIYSRFGSIPKFVTFNNNIKIFKPTKYWKIGYDELELEFKINTQELHPKNIS